MKIKIYLISGLMLVGCITKAQVSKKSFYQGVDLINCKLVEISLRNHKLDLFTQFKDNCNCQNNPNYEKISAAIPLNETQTIALSSEINKIKINEFRTTLSAETAVKLLSEDIYSDEIKYRKLYNFNKRRKNDSEFTASKSEIKTNLTKLFSDEPASKAPVSNKNQDSVQQKPPSLEERINNIEERLSSETQNKSWFEGFKFDIDVFSIIISVGLMLIIIVLIGKSKDSENEVSDKVKAYINHKIENQFRSGNSSNPSSSEIKSMKEIENIKSELRALTEKLQIYKETFDDKMNDFSRQGVPGDEQIKEESKENLDIFYLSTPNSDGSFNQSSVSNTYKEGASIYQFTRTSSNRAKFRIHEKDASVKLALAFPDKNIDRACEATNAYNPKANKIVTIYEGSAELSGDKWIIREKAKISYEG